MWRRSNSVHNHSLYCGGVAPNMITNDSANMALLNFFMSLLNPTHKTQWWGYRGDHGKSLIGAPAPCQTQKMVGTRLM